MSGPPFRIRFFHDQLFEVLCTTLCCLGLHHVSQIQYFRVCQNVDVGTVMIWKDFGEHVVTDALPTYASCSSFDTSRLVNVDCDAGTAWLDSPPEHLDTMAFLIGQNAFGVTCMHTLTVPVVSFQRCLWQDMHGFPISRHAF